jgi:hypothetical protein
MHRPQTVFRFQLAILAAALVLSGLYFLLYRPLSQRVASLDDTLKSAWQKLVNRTAPYPAIDGIHLEDVRRTQLLAEKGFAGMNRTARMIRGKIEFPREVRDKLRQPFELYDFHESRLQMIASARQQAEAKKCNLAPEVYANYPDFISGNEKFNLLWSQLNIYHQVVQSAITSGFSSIKSLKMAGDLTHPPLEADNSVLEEHCVRIEAEGTMDATAKFLFSIPLQGKECKDLGLLEALPNKPALYLHRIIVKAGGAPNDARLEAVVSGFINRETMP